MFLHEKAAASNQEQSEHLKQTFALQVTGSNASTARVPPPSSDEAKALSDAKQPRKAQREETEPSRSAVPPPTDNASPVASSSTPTAGVPPPSSDEALDFNDAMQTRKVTREETEPSRSGATPPTDNANAAACEQISCTHVCCRL